MGDGHPNPEKRGGAVCEKFFSTVGHQYGLKIRGGGGPLPPGPFPWIRHCNNKRSNNHGHEDCLRRIL